MFLSTALMCVLLLGGCSLQEDIVRLDMRLATLESAQANLKETATQAETESSQLRTRFAEIQAEIDALRAELNRVRGGVEETQYALREKLAKAGADAELKRLEARVRQIEAYLDLQPGEAPRPEAAVGGGAVVAPAPDPPAPVLESPEALYQAAKRDFDRGAYEAAKNGFQQFLERHPKDPNADNARFWLGETYYREQWYEKAILEYQEVIENYPDGNKVPASLLKQGLAFFNLGDKGNARLILKELIRKYPDSSEAKIARQKIEGMN
jgi:tol-pal system protein YbgF